ncbi:hypothetical protein BDW22DRAFT_663476 [Trametopsis cervina]|nr:hypothetical protein BDW22DRAFT_663476 [Trametopsis cervina]
MLNSLAVRQLAIGAHSELSSGIHHGIPRILISHIRHVPRSWIYHAHLCFSRQSRLKSCISSAFHHICTWNLHRGAGPGRILISRAAVFMVLHTLAVSPPFPFDDSLLSL